jgi:hypothetical protein
MESPRENSVRQQPPENESLAAQNSPGPELHALLNRRLATIRRHRPSLWDRRKWLAGSYAARRAAGWLTFVLPFAGLLAWFRVADVYHLQFFEAQSKWTYLIYNCLRALYSLYLIWLLYSVGAIVLRFLEKRGVRLDLGLLGEAVLCFYAGAAITSAVGFLAGYLGLYHYWILAPATVLLLGVSYGRFLALVARAGASWRAACAQEKHALNAGAGLLAVGAVIFLAVLLLVMKALPPGGGHDYYTHYFPYFKQVVGYHGLWPNDVWYHYYVSKGATLVFWSVVLTDLQAPEIVTYAFVLVAGLAACSIVWRWCGNPALAVAAMAAYLAAFVLTSHEGDPAEWGQFQKHHELTGSLIAGLAWLTLVMPGCAGTTLSTWSLYAALFAANTVLFAPTACPLVVVLLALGMLGWALRKHWRMAQCFGAAIAAATAVLAFLLALNYRTTGLAEVTPMRFFWKHADQERFSQVWSPYLMVLLLEGSAPEMGNVEVTLPSGTSLWEFSKTLLRYHHLSNFFPAEASIPCR